MKVYSDSKVSDYLRDVTIDQRIRCLNERNARRDHREKIYISYDSTNKKSQAGEIDMVELGHSKGGIEERRHKKILNAFGMTVENIHRQASALGAVCYGA